MAQARRYGVVVFGASLGGIEALRVILHGLRGELPVPLVVAQHIGPSPSRLDEVLGWAAPVPVTWAVDGGRAAAGTVYLCPSRSNVRLEPDGIFRVRPSDERTSLGTINSLFASVADSFGPATMAVVLTGMGTDGTAGARAVRAAGGTVIVQDEVTATAPGMPSSVTAAGLADLVVSLPEIADLLEDVVGRGKPLPTPAVLAAEAMFAAGGETGALMAAADWSGLPLGPVERWSPVLLANLATALASPLPLSVFWGPDLIQLYNDSYRAVIGACHPGALGSPLPSNGAGQAGLLGPSLRQVRESGRSVLVEKARLVVEFAGRPAESFFTFSCTPLRVGDETAGIMVALFEVTEQVRSARRLRALHQLASAVPGDQADERTRDQWLATVLATADLSFVLLYRPDEAGRELQLAAAAGVQAGSAAAPWRLSVDQAGCWPVAGAWRRGEVTAVDDLAARFADLAGDWPAPLQAGLVVPCGHRADGTPAAVLAAAVNPLVPLDAALRSYVELLAGQVGAAVLAPRTHRDLRARLSR